MSQNVYHSGLRPEERKEAVRNGLREAARILGELAERHDLGAEAFEFEMRMQAMWLNLSANQWKKAAEEEAAVLRLREFYLKREGAMQ